MLDSCMFYLFVRNFRAICYPTISVGLWCLLPDQLDPHIYEVLCWYLLRFHVSVCRLTLPPIGPLQVMLSGL